jgi:hypothetical protein
MFDLCHFFLTSPLIFLCSQNHSGTPHQKSIMTMKGEPLTPGQMIKVIKESEMGVTNIDMCRKYGISEQTCYWWKRKCGGMDVSDAMRLKILLAQKHKRYGSPRLHALLKQEENFINDKRTERIFAEKGLAIRRKKKKKRLSSLRVPLPEATTLHETWSMDFVHDACTNGARVNVLTLVDDFTRSCPGLLAQSTIPGRKVNTFLHQQATIYRLSRQHLRGQRTGIYGEALSAMGPTTWDLYRLH